MKFSASVCLALAASVGAQQLPTQQDEVHPDMYYYECAADGSCTGQKKSIVLDSNWRWSDVDATNCYLGNEWDATLCPDETTCAKACSIEGADYPGTYGVTAKGDSVALRFVTNGTYSRSVGQRTYMLEDENTYKQWYLKNKEFAFTVDLSESGCGLNAALYFVEMDPTGQIGTGDNAAGAALGTGYCDAQCPHDLKWINGEANLVDWSPDDDNTDTGKGKYGTCCFELDIWEANIHAQQTTPHTCSVDGQYRCENATDCGDNDGVNRNAGVCDKNGCDFNPSRMGDTTFYGNDASFAIDTTKPFRVVTQFITADNTDDGDLTEIKRYYIQEGKKVENPSIKFEGSETTYDSITDEFCDAKTAAFEAAGDVYTFKDRGGMKNMGASMGRGLTLVVSLWDDYEANMLWLDARYPPDEDLKDIDGVYRGPCDTSSGLPTEVEATYGDAQVYWSKIKIGPIGFTEAGGLSDDDDYFSGDDAKADDEAPATGCTTSADCTDTVDDTCCSITGYSQCIACDQTHFNYECGYWSTDFKTAAETLCGVSCNPSVIA